MNTVRPTIEGKFPKLSLPFYGDVSLGNYTQYKVALMQTPNNRLFVGIECRGSYTFQNWCHWEYAGEKLGLESNSDAANIADFINSQLGHQLEFEGRLYQGRYEQSLCDNPAPIHEDEK